MSINRTNITISADGSDIFTVATVDSPFTNLAKLTTLGDLSSAIRAGADGVTIVNKGTLSTTGNGSSGVVVGELFGAGYDNVTVTNYGKIVVTGDFYDDGTTLAVAGGIEFSAGNHETGINYGSITAIEGMGLAGNNSTLINYGSIDALGAGIVLQGTDQASTGNLAINYGTIHMGADSASQWAIAFFSDHGVVKNYGKIQVDGFHDFGIAIEGVGSYGENFGTIFSAADQARGVLLNFYENEFVNRGSIQTTGEASIGVRWAVGEVDPDSDGGKFTNYGSVSSAGWSVRGNEQDNFVVNHGVLNGDVSLEEADDTYVAGKGGSLAGTLTLGDGNDLIVFEKNGGKLTVTDFVAGAGTDDVIDLSAFGYHSFAEAMSHASQVGADVVLKLGVQDELRLQEVALGALAPDDFLLSSALQVHAPLSPDLLGMHY